MLQHVRRCPLITLAPGRNRRVLLFPLEGVSHLEVVLLLLLANTDVSQISMGLLAERRIWGGRGPHTRSGVVIRMSRGIEVVLIFQQQVDGQPGHPGLELVVEDQVGIKEARKEMRVAIGVDEGRVRHTVGGERASAHKRGCSRLRSASPTLNRRATGAFAGCSYYNRNRVSGSADGDRSCAARVRCPYSKRAGIQYRVRITPVQNSKRRRQRPELQWLQTASDLTTHRKRIMSVTAHSEGLCTSASDFVVEQLHELQIDVLDDRHALEILRELLHETLGVDIRIEGHRGARPSECKFAGGRREPLGSHWVVSDVASIQSNRLSVEVVGQGLVGGRGIPQRARRQRNACDEVVVQFAFESETNAD